MDTNEKNTYSLKELIETLQILYENEDHKDDYVDFKINWNDETSFDIRQIHVVTYAKDNNDKCKIHLEMY